MIVREFLTHLGFSSDESKVHSFDAAVNKLAIGLGALVGVATAASAAAFGLAKAAADYGDEVAKTSALIGISAQALQEYRFAFNDLGVSEAEATKGLEKFSRSMGNALEGKGTEFDAFKRLGVSIKDAQGNLRGMEEMLPLAADALAKVGTEAERTAIAQDLFGRSGGRLAMAFSAGGAEIDELRARFRALGGGMTNEQAAAAEVFGDALGHMTTALQGLKLQIGARLMPIILPMIEAFTEFLVINRELIMERIHRTFEILIGVMRTLARILRGVWNFVDGLANAMGGWETVIQVVTAALLALVAIQAARWFIIAAAAARGFIAALSFAKIGGLLLLAGKLALLVFALDELVSWWKDEESYLGDFIAWLQELGFAENAATAIGLLTVALAGLLALKGLGKLAAMLGLVAGGVKGIAAGGGAAAAVGGAAAGAGLAAMSGPIAGLVAALKPTQAGDGTITPEVEAWQRANPGVKLGPNVPGYVLEPEAEKPFDDSGLTESQKKRRAVVLDTITGNQGAREKAIDGNVTPLVTPNVPNAPVPFDAPDINNVIEFDFGPLQKEMQAIKDYLGNMSFEPSTGPEMPAPNIDNTKNTTLNMNVNQSITVPPGTTAEQVAVIKNIVRTSMEREVNRAATALEA